ncbi:MAG: hypothetical protein R3C19_10025 [Planctomycetaceae bacterium]
MIASARKTKTRRRISRMGDTNGRTRAPRQRPRIVLYSHDTMGIGHMRRNLLVAQTLTQAPVDGHVLMLAGASEAGVFASHAGIDCVTLPALHKNPAGSYSARNLCFSLAEIIRLRRQTIRAAVSAFQPDILIVDKVPRGVLNELDDTLTDLNRTGRTRCVLGLRDILDTPSIVHQEFESGGYRRAITKHYDHVWIYGDRNVFDPIREYDLHDISDRIRFTGYLDQKARLLEWKQSGTNEESALHGPASNRSHGTSGTHLFDESQQMPGHPEVDSPNVRDTRDELVACFVGGGQDGFSVAAAFCQSHFPEGVSGVILAGPCMPDADRRTLRQLAESRPRLQFIDSMIEADLLMNRADRVVAMGGYNTVSSILSFNKPALIVPRVTPREEQLMRAERLRDLGLVQVLHPSNLSPAAISDWLRNPPVDRLSSRSVLDLDGLHRITDLVNELVHPVTSPRAMSATE